MQGFVLLIILIFLGAFIAYSGDFIGRRIGRRRISLFGLRPKYTAIIITTISGIFIAVFTLLIMIVFSQDVRTALFGLEKLKMQIIESGSALKKTKIMHAIQTLSLKSELRSLEAAVAKSRQMLTAAQKQEKKLMVSIEKSRSGTVRFKVHENLYTTLVRGNSDVRKILSLTKKKVSQTVILPDYQYNEAVAYLEANSAESVVRIIAAKNVLFGEPIPVNIEILSNIMIFKKGDIIISRFIDGGQSQTEIERQLNSMVEEAKLAARKKGIYDDESVSPTDIYSAAKRLMFWKRELQVDILAKDDIYIIGPLKIEIKVIEWPS